MSFGIRFKEIRKKMGKNQTEFGEILEINQMKLSRLENNQNESIEFSIVEKLEKMNINIGWLLTGEGEMFRNEDQLTTDTPNTIKIPLLDVKASAGSGFVNLKSLRKEKGYTQEELSDKLGISQNYLSDIETGKVTLTEKLRIALGELGIHIVEEKNGIISIPFIDISASAGLGIMNLTDCPHVNLLNIPSELVDIPIKELEGCHVIKARGNSMTPIIDNGDRLIVKELKEIPKYIEGNYIINYDGEIYVKTIQLGQNKLIMKSLNKDFEDIVISNLEESDVHLQIVAKVLVIIKNI